jgi:outer membrane protein assembly factor BamB
MIGPELIYIGIRGSVVALEAATGQTVWATHLTGGEFVNVGVHCGKVIATCRGEVFCLDSRTGEGLWHNQLKGYGWGLATITSMGAEATNLLPSVERRLRDQRAAATASS